MAEGSNNCEICPPIDVRQCEVADEGHQPMTAAAEFAAERIGGRDDAGDEIPDDDVLRHGAIDRQTSTKMAASRSNSLLRRIEEDGGSDEGDDSDSDDDHAESFTLEMLNCLTADAEDSRRPKKAEPTSSKSENVEAPARKTGGISGPLKNRMSLAQAANKVKATARLVNAFRTPPAAFVDVVINMEVRPLCLLLTERRCLLEGLMGQSPLIPFLPLSIVHRMNLITQSLPALSTRNQT